MPADNDAARLSALARETAAAVSVDECKRAPNEVTEQIAFADKLLLNKSDMVSPEHLERLEQRIRRINPFAEVLRCSHANVDLDRVLNIGAFDLRRVAETLQAENDDHGHGHGHGHGHSHGHGHGHGHGDDVHQAHDAAVTSVAITHDGPMDYKKIEQWLGQLLYEHGESICTLPSAPVCTCSCSISSVSLPTLCGLADRSDEGGVGAGRGQRQS